MNRKPCSQRHWPPKPSSPRHSHLSGTSQPVVVGNTADVHVHAVLRALEAIGAPADFRDASRPIGYEEYGRVFARSRRSRGWIRARWAQPRDQRPFAEAAWKDIGDALVRDPFVQWLSPADALENADNKLVQLRAAEQLGIAQPRSVVPATVDELRSTLGARVVLKPLGHGLVQRRGQRAVFYATAIDCDDLTDAELRAVPVLAQELLEAEHHLRVVTVLGEVWQAQLRHPRADGAPIDWREWPPTARKGWEESAITPRLRSAALSLASVFRIGYSSQDWIVTKHGPVFVDLNPNGNWLFLPCRVSSDITKKIAEWLAASG